MPLTTGSRIGPYEVLAALGAGGMGEVYRARDTKLHRDVAIKVLQKKHQVSVNGGSWPTWSVRGDEVFFVANNTLMAAAVQRGAALATAVPQALFTAAKIGASAIGYDVAADGKRFVVVRTLAPRERRAVVVENWVSRLEAAK